MAISTSRFVTLLSLVAPFVMVACDVADDAGADLHPEKVEQVGRSEVNNAQHLNSAVLNGIQLNGIQLNGIQLNGIQLNGIQLNSQQFNGIQLNGSVFTGTLNSVVHTGEDFIGAEMELTAGSTTYTLRFDDIYENPDQPGKGVFFHDISISDDDGATWDALCRKPTGEPTQAILLANYWNPTTGARVDDADAITFACRYAVLAKCVEWGYIPWSSVEQCEGQTCDTVELQDYHQTCTRMARADYCGTGQSYTFNGTPIDLYDHLNPRLQTRSTSTIAGWGVEAEWGPNGATCIGDELRMTMYDESNIPYTLPTCLDDIDDASDCGAFPAGRPDSKIANAYCHTWTSNPENCMENNDDAPI